MEQTPLQEQVQTSTKNSSSADQSQDRNTNTLRNITSLAAAVLFGSFFAPWATFLGSKLSGLDIQKNFESYKFVWLVPACALVALILNMAGLRTASVRRAAGGVPLTILIYSLYKFGSDFFQLIAWGGWLALAAGIVLIIVPAATKLQPKA
jgi:hypothetical protein